MAPFLTRSLELSQCPHSCHVTMKGTRLLQDIDASLPRGKLRNPNLASMSDQRSLLLSGTQSIGRCAFSDADLASVLVPGSDLHD